MHAKGDGQDSGFAGGMRDGERRTDIRPQAAVVGSIDTPGVNTSDSNAYPMHGNGGERRTDIRPLPGSRRGDSVRFASSISGAACSLEDDTWLRRIPSDAPSGEKAAEKTPRSSLRKHSNIPVSPKRSKVENAAPQQPGATGLAVSGNINANNGDPHTSLPPPPLQAGLPVSVDAAWRAWGEAMGEVVGRALHSSLAANSRSIRSSRARLKKKHQPAGRKEASLHAHKPDAACVQAHQTMPQCQPWLPPGATSLGRSSSVAIKPAPRIGQPAGGRPFGRRPHKSTNPHRSEDACENSNKLPAPAPALVSSSSGLPSSTALALGASVIELLPQHPTFELCTQLLLRQPLCEGRMTLSVLRVLQCRGHYVDIHHLDILGLPPYASTDSVSANSSGAVSPRLAFVTGDLTAVSTFIRSGLRLLGANSSTRQEQLIRAGLSVSGQLAADAGWGQSSAPDAKTHKSSEAETSLLQIWRLVLAVCWPVGTGGLDCAAMPAFIVDYAAEERAAQLNFGLT